MSGMAPRKQQEIFDATLRLVAEKGYDGLTVEGVAERSGVNKTTIYRWWPSKAALLGAALIESDVLGFDAPDTGSLRGDLVALVEGVRRLLTEPPGSDIAVAALGAAVRHPELDARRFFADRFADADRRPAGGRRVDAGGLPRVAGGRRLRHRRGLGPPRRRLTRHRPGLAAPLISDRFHDARHR
jgi:AcrR family transcriptional regulator